MTICLMGFIYIATAPNKEQKKYVGQTMQTLEKRFAGHRRKDNGCHVFARAIKKYGWDNFVIDYYECPDEDLDKHERWMIRLLGTLTPDGYNLREGGSNGKLSEETKQKISDAAKGNKKCLGRIVSVETRKKQSNANKGNMVSEKTRKKISNSLKGHKINLGRIASEETKKKMSNAKKGGKHPRARPVWVYGILYDSCSSASNYLRFLFDMKSNFILKWVKSKKYSEIFFA
ncbi:GIY-YIG catalytic domain-containing endonuclease [Paramecium bursaria Chlorella virus NY2B]|uniref:GIY-YIG catalytic domain-containing endonuclease n=1 Tax=Paramecium bursaria Chlorella virus NYs1 TaxID=83442 RepID=M1I3J3_9PHYC|nr:GIY-YIG catalytic domain-containing endonuclease [Paramecium bursaria Chlorella virus NYs1]AGE54341.1 GIY-YIG catalytic domain-containing endonuclease [Paramecium bursaria Chlorella virus IL-5-2s1]AGE58459.1 GIY-YIG catalytic domain-containing endonuclease [Paramecium bursaria Chlorella virus NY2B]AGE58842.1 GIY-YIG catalytic domain-containing endonuclease [Paramecium bursaria Chlorella virus NYs1]